MTSEMFTRHPTSGRQFPFLKPASGASLRPLMTLQPPTGQFSDRIALLQVIFLLFFITRETG